MLVKIVSHNEHTGKAVLHTHNEEYLVVSIKYRYGIEEGQYLRHKDFTEFTSEDVYNINTGEYLNINVYCSCKTKEEADAFILTESKYLN